MISAKGIFKSYNKLQVLKGIDLDINQGEIVSIVGASGAGKSTLLHILGTLDTADRGKISIDNIELTSLSSKKISQFRNSKIGFVFQAHHLLPEFTALENVMMPALIRGELRQTVEKRSTELLHKLELSHRLSHRPSEMSGGEQQRVAVARALINRPAVILADEPSGNLDSESANALHNLFFDLRKTINQTFVIVTHNEKLAEMADRKLVMKDGVLLG
jgi:lipoprotein-releasing system ATP-binding protein